MRIDRLISELISRPDATIGNGALENEIAHACQVLSAHLPVDYTEFLSKIGWGGAGHWGIYGTGNGVPRHLDLVSETQLERTLFCPNLPAHLIPVMADGGGNHYCLDTNSIEFGLCPVVFWDHDLGEDQVPDVMSNSFTDLFEEQLRSLEDSHN